MKKIVSVLIICVMLWSSLGMSAMATSSETEGPYTQPEKFIYGDVDLDSVVTVKDATLVQKGVAGITYVTAVQKYLADPKSEGFNVKNATAIQKYLAGHEIESMIGEELDMSSQDEFSKKAYNMLPVFGEYIVVTPKDVNCEYTLDDFPEYPFSRIKRNEWVYSNYKYVDYELYLHQPSEENVLEAVKVLDYRANIDLKSVEVLGIVPPT